MTIATNRLGQVLDLTESARAAKRGHALDGQCWWNACRALRTVYARTPGAHYVEGHAVGECPIVISHGWIELLGGIVVDPTPCFHDDRARHLDTAPCYFPGLRYTVAALRARGRTPKMLPYALGDDWGRSNAPWMASYRAAHVFAYGHTPEEMMTRLRRHPMFAPFAANPMVAAIVSLEAAT